MKTMIMVVDQRGGSYGSLRVCNKFSKEEEDFGDPLWRSILVSVETWHRGKCRSWKIFLHKKEGDVGKCWWRIPVIAGRDEW